MPDALNLFKICVVDDNVVFRDSAKALLNALGYNVDVFVSGEEFLASRRAAQTACLILDMNIPGMTGDVLHERLVADGHLIPTIFVSGHSDPRDRITMLAAGGCCFLEKPFNVRLLLDYLDKATQPTVARLLV